MPKHGDYPYFFPKSDKTVDIPYKVTVIVEGENEPPEATVSKVEVYQQATSASGTVVTSKNDLNKHGSGTYPLKIETYAAKTHSPLFCWFTFTKDYKSGPKKDTSETTHGQKGVHLADPAVKTIEAPAEAKQGTDDKVTLKATAWAAYVYKAKATASVEDDPKNFPNGEKANLRWHVSEDGGKTWESDLGSKGESVELPIAKERLGKTLTVEAYFDDAIKVQGRARAEILVPKLEIVDAKGVKPPDKLGFGASLELKAKCTPAVKGEYTWTSGADPIRIIDGKDAAVGTLAKVDGVTVKALKEGADTELKLQLKSEATGKVYEVTHKLSVDKPKLEITKVDPYFAPAGKAGLKGPDKLTVTYSIAKLGAKGQKVVLEVDGKGYGNNPVFSRELTETERADKDGATLEWDGKANTKGGALAGSKELTPDYSPYTVRLRVDDKHLTSDKLVDTVSKSEKETKVLQWPVLELKEIEFSGTKCHTVNRDTLGDFDKKWTKGRTTKLQSALCYTRKNPVELKATFTVKTKPTEDEKVILRGRGELKSSKGKTTKLEWVSSGPGHVSVGKAASEVTLPKTSCVTRADPKKEATTAAKLPDHVEAYDLEMTWEISNPDPKESDWSSVDWKDITWTKITTTSHRLYGVLADPVGGAKLYWTGLDISCTGAAEKTSEGDVVKGTFAPLKAATGDGNGIPRQADGVKLSYYLKGISTGSIFTCEKLLSTPDGSGRCGSWAEFLVAMYKMHGITKGTNFGVEPVSKSEADILLVKNLTFTGGGTAAAPFPHKYSGDVAKANGIAGQGCTNPQFLFANHALVDYDGTDIYDPSYGVGPYTDLKKWEDDGIAGLSFSGVGNANLTVFTHDSKSQAIGKRNSKGFITYSFKSTDTVNGVAAAHGVASGDALFNHPFNAALKTLRTSKGNVQAGDKLYIPRDISTSAILVRY